MQYSIRCTSCKYVGRGHSVYFWDKTLQPTAVKLYIYITHIYMCVCTDRHIIALYKYQLTSLLECKIRQSACLAVPEHVKSILYVPYITQATITQTLLAQGIQWDDRIAGPGLVHLNKLSISPYRKFGVVELNNNRINTWVY